MRTVIKIPPRKSHKGVGSFGSYYILNKRQKIGVKILKPFESPKRIQTDFLYHLHRLTDGYKIRYFNGFGCCRGTMMECAAQELVVMEMLEGFAVPKAHGLVWVEYEGQYTIGILMEHINGRTTWDEDHKTKALEHEAYTRWVKKTGIKVDDWHGGNVLETRNREYVRIDLGAGFFSVEKKAQKEFAKRVHYWIHHLMSTFPEKKAFGA